MCVNQRFRNSEAEAEAPKTASDRGLALLEGIEDFVDLFRLNTHATIDDADHDFLWRWIERLNHDAAFRGRELHAVLDQIPKDLLQARGITFDKRMHSAKTKLHFEMLGANLLLANLVCALEDFMYASSLET